MANKILRLATNSFDTDSAHQLEVLGGPRLPRPLAYVIACITRAAIKTLDGFEVQHDSLIQAVHLHESLAISAHYNPIPDGWDSDAYCSNLTKAVSGELANEYFPGTRNAIIAIREDFRKKKLKQGLQKSIYKCLLSSVPFALEKVFLARFSKIGIPPDISHLFSQDQIKEFAKTFKCCSKAFIPSAKMALIRTWSNGWFTSYRTQAKTTGGIKLPCIFGCDHEEDSLHHYLQCDPLWTIVVSSTCSQVDVLKWSPPQKACLVDPSPQSFALCMIAFQVYHAMRNTYQQDINQAVLNSDFCPVVCTAFELACHFAEETQLR